MPGKIARPHSVVEDTNEGGWKEFRLEDILKWQSQKEIDPLTIKKLTVEGDIKYPFYGQSTLNNGVISYESLNENVLNNKNGLPTILIHSNNQNVVYLETPFYLKDGHGATSVLQADFLNEHSALFLMTSIKKTIHRKFSYQAKATKIALKNTCISLPTTKDGEIDLTYMENYIQFLINERLNELDKFVEENGYHDSDLTFAEVQSLKDFENGKVKFEKFKIGDLFDIHPTKSYGMTNDKLFAMEGNIPVVANSAIQNGIGGWVNLEATEKGNMVVYSDTTTSDSIFYQPFDFVGYSHVQGLYAFNEVWNENSLLYFVTAFKKSASGRFNYGNKFTRSIASEMMVSLPKTNNGEIDFAYMENYISAQKKLAMKPVTGFTAFDDNDLKYVDVTEVSLAANKDDKNG